MRRTLSRWLLRYCQELTETETTSIKKLYAAVEENAPHAAEALLLYAYCTEKEQALLKMAAHSPLCREWADVLQTIACYGEEPASREECLSKAYSYLPIRYQKALDSFYALDEQAANNRIVSGEMAQATAKLIAEKHLSKYQICHDLGLNEGNFYAWLRGDAAKLSRATASKVWRYTSSL